MIGIFICVYPNFIDAHGKLSFQTFVSKSMDVVLLKHLARILDHPKVTVLGLLLRLLLRSQPLRAISRDTLSSLMMCLMLRPSVYSWNIWRRWTKNRCRCLFGNLVPKFASCFSPGM